jgi:hypothetical protein
MTEIKKASKILVEKGGDHFAELCIDERIIFNRILRKQVMKFQLAKNKMKWQDVVKTVKEDTVP